MPKVGLVAVMDFANVPEDEFHEWYDTEHLPERRRIPGFITCERWLGATQPTYSVGTYDLSDMDVLQSDAYRAVTFENASPWAKRVTGKCTRIMRVASEQIVPGDMLAPEGAGGLLLSALNIAPQHEGDFTSWFDTEHLPALAAVPGTLAARRFVSRDGSHRHLALYHLSSPEVLDSTAWKRAARTPWTERLLPHFQDRVRIVCRQRTQAG